MLTDFWKDITAFGSLAFSLIIIAASIALGKNDLALLLIAALALCYAIGFPIKVFFLGAPQRAEILFPAQQIRGILLPQRAYHARGELRHRAVRLSGERPVRLHRRRHRAGSDVHPRPPPEALPE